jgi:DNA-binding transcriptional regulator YiaG
MKVLRDYQLKISKDAYNILKRLGFVYLALEVRVGKTAIALNTAHIYGAKNILFVTKKKAIKSIENDYIDFGFKFNLTVTNAESLHKIVGNFDLIISDEHHKYGAFPKPSEGTKYFKSRFGHLPIIALSGTMNPESYSQVYHQFWVSNNSPFKQYKNFYQWALHFVNIGQKYLGYAVVKDYSVAKGGLIQSFIEPYIITYTQKEAGFTSEVIERILTVEMKQSTYDLIAKLKNDNIIEGKTEVIIADTGAKMMSKLHQMYSGTVKFESGKSIVLDKSKALFIKSQFATTKIAIFYKFKEELNVIQDILGETVTTDLNEFSTTDKSIALQIVSGREGINLSAAKYIVYYNIDFSAVSYWQSRDRLTTMDRLSNEVFWIFAKGGIEHHIYKQVMAKKNFTLSTFNKTYGK